ncbi:MAG: phosphoadenosine phosphosulfate reductase [Betaproteobacteria bacterium RIFCSPLOWO2_02_FULL_65_24]|nr:MAG: phosphoadenosine phosphosulfate reductase [Betaproteobacteria bacterium RIFCSPLOWO2_02_FULL_65_24]OGA79764.1 MAG: phosphoadenosine phosphosulfate reductase [Betaproteobacteria bacterium RIFCSPLOWO2_12_FULL_66_14]
MTREYHGTGLPPRLALKVEALEALLARIARDYAPSALASSLSIEDMVLTDAILRHREENAAGIEIFTLDTGRLHADTLAVIDAIRQRYGYSLRVYRPEASAVAAYVAVHGRDGFYRSVESRKRCCEIRKVEPLKRALSGHTSWLTGMRREQSLTRAALELQSHDAVHGMEKFSPIADWTEDDVWQYLRAFAVPYNALYDQGYRSIGCAPCTRPVVAGEDVRAGRWWWEQPESKECGLHVAPDGTLQRTRNLLEETTS